MRVRGGAGAEAAVESPVIKARAMAALNLLDAVMALSTDFVLNYNSANTGKPENTAYLTLVMSSEDAKQRSDRPLAGVRGLLRALICFVNTHVTDAPFIAAGVRGAKAELLALCNAMDALFEKLNDEKIDEAAIASMATALSGAIEALISKVASKRKNEEKLKRLVKITRVSHQVELLSKQLTLGLQGDRFESKAEDYAEKIIALEATVAEKDARITLLSSADSVKDLAEENTALRAQLASAQAALRAQAGMRAMSSSTIMDLRGQVEGLTQEVERLTGEVERLQRNVTEKNDLLDRTVIEAGELASVVLAMKDGVGVFSRVQAGVQAKMAEKSGAKVIVPPPPR